MVNSGQFDGRQAHAGGARRGHRAGWSETGRGKADGQLPPARLADLPPALLGHADPDRLLRGLRHRAGARRRSCRCCCRSTPSSRRPGRVAAGDARGVPQHDLPAVRRTGAARDRHHGHLRRLVLVLVPLPVARTTTTAPFDPALAASWTAGRSLHAAASSTPSCTCSTPASSPRCCATSGLIEHDEPFMRLRNQGMILAEEGTKMSKSRGTQVDPDDLVRRARRRRAAAAPDVPRARGSRAARGTRAASPAWSGSSDAPSGLVTETGAGTVRRAPCRRWMRPRRCDG